MTTKIENVRLDYYPDQSTAPQLIDIEIPFSATDIGKMMDDAYFLSKKYGENLMTISALCDCKCSCEIFETFELEAWGGGFAVKMYTGKEPDEFRTCDLKNEDLTMKRFYFDTEGELWEQDYFGTPLDDCDLIYADTFEMARAIYKSRWPEQSTH